MSIRNFACITIILLFVTATCSAHEAVVDPKVLSQSFINRKDLMILDSAEHGDRANRMYASALIALMSDNIGRLGSVGASCMSSKPQNGADAVAYLDCGLASVAGFTTIYRHNLDKKRYLWIYNVQLFYKRYKNIINKYTSSNDLYDLLENVIPSKHVINTWPDIVVSIKPNWRVVPLNNGFVTINIGGISLPAEVDTGGFGIGIPTAVMEKYGLSKTLIPLGVTLFSKGYSGRSKLHIYYTKSFSMGPIKIINAFVHVSRGKHASIGLNILETLGSFALSRNGIFAKQIARGYVCGAMIDNRYPIYQPWEHPFLRVKTGVGVLGLWADSGMRGMSANSNIDVLLKKSVSSRIAKKYDVQHNRKALLTLYQSGVETKYESLPFAFYLDHAATYAYSYPLHLHDPLISGVLAFPFFTKRYVFYDFDHRKMCLGSNL